MDTALSQPNANLSTPTKKPSSRAPIVILLFVAAIVSAGVSLFLLTARHEAPAENLVTPTEKVTENPFVEEPDDNPFNVVEVNVGVNPFTDSVSSNPFDLFETDTASADSGGGKASGSEYQNPFQ